MEGMSLEWVREDDGRSAFRGRGPLLYSLTAGVWQGSALTSPERLGPARRPMKESRN